MKPKEITPRFIELDGCINCEVYQSYQDVEFVLENDLHRCKWEPKDKKQLHEVLAGCVILSCKQYGYDVLKPFIGLNEIYLYWIKHLEIQTKENKNNISNYIKFLRENYSPHYSKLPKTFKEFV